MIGLGSYSFFWQHSGRVSHPLTLQGALEATRELDADLFQICDYAPLDAMSDREVQRTAAVAKDLSVALELGTRGIGSERLLRYRQLAESLDARLVRTMLPDRSARPTLIDAERELRRLLPAYEDAGVVLALETYEEVATADLVALIESIGSDCLRICLDPANIVARLERPRDCVEAAAPYVGCVHVKDFAFSRQAGWVGFTFGGVPMGQGLHDYEHLLATVCPRERGVNEVVEHWLPWQGDAETTTRAEQDWTRQALDYLRRIQ